MKYVKLIFKLLFLIFVIIFFVELFRQIRKPSVEFNPVPKIDTTQLKDGESIISAKKIVLAAIIADSLEKKRIPKYKSKKAALLELKLKVISRAQSYSKSMDPEKANNFLVEFNKY